MFIFPKKNITSFLLIWIKIICYYCTTSTTGFNIDTEYPIVISDQFDHPSSHFGYTVLLMEKRFSTFGSHGWIIIGAPKANSTYANKTLINEPGVVWRCRIGPNNTTFDPQNICKLVEMDPTYRNDEFLGKRTNHEMLAYLDYKDESWLSGSMVLGQSDRFIACASRWANQKFKDKLLLTGICYWISKNILNEINTNSTWPWLTEQFENFNYRLNPLLDKDQIMYNNTDKYFWGLGQAGFSSHISEDNFLILGAPGVRQWEGTVIEYRDSNRTKSTTFGKYGFNSRFNSVGPEFAEYSVASIGRDVLEKSSYFGYAVTSGHFFYPTNITQNKKQYAGGAPRSKSHFGQVLIFIFNDSPAHKVETDITQIVQPIEITQGIDDFGSAHDSGFGSYFGSVLLAVDCNNDGFDELIVGAPLHSQFKRKKAEEKVGESSKSESISYGDEGVVFVYFSNGTDFDRNPYKLYGNGVRGSRFGSAMSSLGDINSDHYNDIAIGAPYENDRGAVYIYFGNSEKKLTLMQRISPENIDIKGFGISVSTGVDIDENLTNDLAVGVYENNKALVFRTLPVVKLIGNVTISRNKLYSNVVDYDVKCCLSYESKQKYSSPLRIWINLTSDIENRQVKLVEWAGRKESIKFSSNWLQNISFYEDSIQGFVKVGKFGKCGILRLKRITEIEEIISKPITIKMESWIFNDSNDSEMTKSNPITYHITKSSNSPLPQVEITGSNFTNFYKKNPLMYMNTSEVTIFKLEVASVCEDDLDPICIANVSINASFQSVNQDFVIGSVDKFPIKIDIDNFREKTETPFEILVLWNGHFPKPKSMNNCSYAANVYRCNLTISNPIYKFKKKSVEMDLDMRGIYAGEIADNKFDFNYSILTTSQLVPESKTFGNLVLPLKSDFDFIFEGSSRTFTHYYSYNMTDKIDLAQGFRIKLEGITPVYAIKIQFRIPIKIQLNDYEDMVKFLELTKPEIGDKFQCKRPKDFKYYINPSMKEFFYDDIDDSTATDVYSDTYTDTDSFFTPYSNDILDAYFEKPLNISTEYNSNSTASDKEKQSFRINCDKSNERIECVKIICIAKYLSAKDFVDVKSKMNRLIFSMKIDSKLVQKIFQENQEINSIILESEGLLTVLNQKGETYKERMILRKTTNKNIIELRKSSEIDSWILIAAAGGGLLLLSIIILTLYKVGFFRRTKKEELEALVEKYKEFEGETKRIQSRYHNTSIETLAQIK